jgi:hypothetical protein
MAGQVHSLQRLGRFMTTVYIMHPLPDALARRDDLGAKRRFKG